MNRRICSTLLSTLCIASLSLPFSAAQAQSTLDKIIASKNLRCGVQLDYPPLGFRNANNEPAGYDVEYCHDIAKALGAQAEIVETPSAERIPALVSNRIDVLVAGTSITPQRALSVAFTQPYVSHTVVVLTRKDASIQSFEDMKGRSIGGVTGSTTAITLQSFFDTWNDPKGRFTSFSNEAESFLALKQGKIDGLILGNSAAGALVRSGQFPEFVIAGDVPTAPDFGGLAVRKNDEAFLRWLRVFVWSQGINGRYQELYNQFFGPGPAPALSYPGIPY